MAKVTIEDISRSTGYSRGTVSRALNNRPDISEQTKQRVLQACRELDYVPSHAARSLATGRCYAVAVVVDDLRDVFAAEFVRGVLEASRPERYAVCVSELGDAAVDVIAALESFVNERVDAVLLAAHVPISQAGRIASCAKTRPLVTTDAIDGVSCDRLVPDYVESGRLVARHLAPRGPFLYVFDARHAHERLQAEGVAEVCQTLGIDPSTVMADVGGDAARLMDLRPRFQEARAIATGSDALALRTVLLCHELQRRPGIDVRIAGQGNDRVSTLISPALTTTDYCGMEIGRRAFETAIQRVTKSRQDSPQQTLVTPRLIERASTS